MAASNYESGNHFTITWRIENANFCWQKEGEHISSPEFVVDTLENTKWSLWLYPKGCRDGSHVGLFLHREDSCSVVKDIEIDYELSFMAADGCSVLTTMKASKHTVAKGQMMGFPNIETWENIFRLKSRVFA
ncbi:speckle-type POZ protein B [Caerostris extrusa]|uniref:Speckle-type POZ protein B n=1 Tax=Caerostris extrusa TaxID=172846 RepID=A0AAV4UFI4_CAEEX|nr:speckle-type POZ protein B [Caerostris extrusa]